MGQFAAIRGVEVGVLTPRQRDAAGVAECGAVASLTLGGNNGADILPERRIHVGANNDPRPHKATDN